MKWFWLIILGVALYAAALWVMRELLPMARGIHAAMVENQRRLESGQGGYEGLAAVKAYLDGTLLEDVEDE